GYATKLIVKSRIEYKVPYFPSNLPISDIPPANSIIQPDRPICAIHTFNLTSSLASYYTAKNIEKQVLLLNQFNQTQYI
ncbi:MAG: hypothetical protein ACTSQY_05685, partial [Candidatus Odinarchaeia archaeon]